jgi:predicted permease
MIILGGSVYLDLQQRGSVHFGGIVKFVLVKNFVFPIIFLLILSIVRPDYSLALILFLESAVPPVSAVPILAERAGGNRSIVNQFVVSSIITSLVSIPLMVMLFDMFFVP